MKKQIAALTARVKELESYCGVLAPLFEKEYQKGGWDFSNGKKKAKR